MKGEENDEERIGRVKLDYTLAQRKREIIQPLKEERSQRIKEITKRSGEGITLMRAGFTIIPSEKNKMLSTAKHTNADCFIHS